MKPAEILMEIAVFFVRAVFIIAMVSVLITRAAFAEETIFPGKPEAVIDLGTKEVWRW